eukprot:jgi/Phyca11/127236/e_gw1.67.22.1
MGDNEHIFQQNNVSIHAARLTKGSLQAKTVTSMEWPVKCPGFNIIENGWGLLASRVYANDRQFDSRAQLMACIKKE